MRLVKSKYKSLILPMNIFMPIGTYTYISTNPSVTHGNLQVLQNVTKLSLYLS